MFSIDEDNIKLHLEIVPVESLLQHEKVLPESVDRLTFEFRNMVTLQNPIIVDVNYLILDGNHRAYAFKKLGFRYIPVCRVDYFHESIRLKCWYRLVEGVKDPDHFEHFIKDMGGEYLQLKDKDMLVSTLEENHLYLGIQTGDSYSVIRFDRRSVYDAVSAYDCVEVIQEEIIKKGVGLTYVPCDYVKEKEFKGPTQKNDFILYTPHITKEMVIDAGKKRKIFAPKTTRHLIPARPLQVNVPASWFKEDILCDELNHRLDQFLRNKGLKRFGPGQVIDGRYYEEALYVFYDKD